MSELDAISRTAPASEAAHSLGDGLTLMPGMLPVPGLGELAVNSFVLDGQQPILVDTGAHVLREGFLKSLRSILDPGRLRWLWLSHLDADHIGNLREVLEEAPEAQIISCRFGQAKMMLHDLPVERVHLVEAGETLRTPDRCLTALRPPYYDAPETLGFFEAESATLFSGDAFGAVLPRVGCTAEELDDKTLQAGMHVWSLLDAPWLPALRREALADALDTLVALQPRRLLSSHLAPSHEPNRLIQLLMHLHERPQQAQAA